MRKFSAGLLLLVASAVCPPTLDRWLLTPVIAQEEATNASEAIDASATINASSTADGSAALNASTTIAASATINVSKTIETPEISGSSEASDSAVAKEDAQILYDEALDLKKQGNLPAAIDSYARAMRLDRSILAFDDNGLIEALKKDCEEKLSKSPEDVKLLETLGFVFAVCYSDHKSAIACYEKVFNLVTDEKIKERTVSLIERLRETEQQQSSYQEEVSAQLRDERLKTWSEMEKLDKFGDDASQTQEKSSKLAEAYKEKDSLKNKVPQLEGELKELQEEYDKANRLWYSLKDNMYERQRRRLKDDIAAKEKEVASAREELEAAESTAATLESELSAVEKEKEASPIRSYEENAPVDQPPANSDDAQPPANNDGAGTPVENPDFPSGADSQNGSESSSDAGKTPDAESNPVADSQKIDELIDNL